MSDEIKKEKKIMFKPYEQVEDVGEFVVYEFKAGYLYAMYGILAIMILGFLTNTFALLIPGSIMMILYFLFVSIKYIKIRRIMKRAILPNSISVSGSKWSFSNPLRIKIRKEFI
jgi:hypothetical protein